MIIMKFGGASLDGAESVKNVVEIISTRLDLQPVVVVSAMGKTTSRLLQAAKLAEAQDVVKSNSLLSDLRDEHLKVYDVFNAGDADSYFLEKINNYFSELKIVLEMIASRKELSPFLQDKVLAYGELISSAILTTALISRQIRAKLLDARICLITDEHFTHAHPKEDESQIKIRGYILPVLKDGMIPVIQGYIGSTQTGETTTLGFEGSDYSAVLIGAALEAKDIQIWKDVPGVMTADPDLIDKPVTIKKMTYEEAAELSLYGAKILHPNTIQPARSKNITIHIYSVRAPEAAGTVIGDRTDHAKPVIKSITCRDKLLMLNIQSGEKSSEFDFLYRLFDIVRQAEVVPYIILGSGKQISLVADDSKKSEAMISLFGSFSKLSIEKNKATISLIGTNVSRNSKLLTEVREYINGEGIELTVSNVSPHSFTFMVDSSRLQTIIRKLHDFIFREINQEIFEATK
ncbi:MAG: aspartate kinase [Calditrichaceae bacterium]